MEHYIPIAYLNDFIFCPRSIYYHQIYASFHQSNYHDKSQKQGLITHKAISDKTYSTAKHILQDLYVYSGYYGLCGKIDIYNSKTKTLIERKHQIKTIYDGQIFQLYGQYFALREMGYDVQNLNFYDASSNKTQIVKKPEEDRIMFKKFEETIDAIKNYRPSQDIYEPNIQKCLNCIYEKLCDVSPC